MYSKRNKTKSPLFLLLILTCFGYACFKFAKVDKSSAETSTNTQPQAQEAATCNTMTDDSSDTSTPVILNIDESGNITDISNGQNGEVLAATSLTSCNAFNKYEASSGCTLDAQSGTTSIFGWVGQNATIEMTSITIPAKLLSGIFSVKDSNRELTNETLTYKPAGEQINNKQIEVNTMPGEEHDTTVKNVITNAITQKAFSVGYQASITGGSASGSDSATVNKYYENDCGDKCNNDANANPDKSNKAGKYLKNVFYDMPGETNRTTTEQQVVLNGSCGTVKTEDVAGIEACFSPIGIIEGLLGDLFPSGDWTKCLTDKDQCVNSATIVVKMSPIAEDINNYTTTQVKVGMDPESSSSYKPFYVMTPCLANISGKGVPVKCVWDLSYLMDNRQAAQFDDLGESDTPTYDQYVRFLKTESSNVGDAEEKIM